MTATSAAAPTVPGFSGLPYAMWQGLWERVQRHAREYRHALPYPNVVLDDVFPAEVLDAVLEEWPDRGDPRWTVHDTPHEQKIVASRQEMLGPTTRALLNDLNGPRFLDCMMRLSGITGLIPDPYFASAGLSDVGAGGTLELHTDFTINSRTGLDRRINVLLYLNHGWGDENGGQLELWRRRPFRRERSVVPVFNRMVVFNTTPDAIHGHPAPVVPPPQDTRKCMSVYYYTRGRPLRESIRGIQGVLFEGVDRPSRHSRVAATARLLIPPVVGAARRELHEVLRPAGE
jgi:2OG-Fe(II) oxygenase superfamily